MHEPRSASSPILEPAVYASDEIAANLGSTERALLRMLNGRAADWSQADRHRVVALAERLWLEPRLAVRLANDPHVPDFARERWLSSRRFTAARNLFLHAEEVNLLQRLEQLGIEVIPLKGTSLARMLGDLAARPVTDIDLGLRAGDVASAAQALRDAGYRVSLPQALLGHRSFLSSTDEFTSEVKCSREAAGSPVVVELHWKWLPVPEDEIWKHVRVYEPCGVRSLAAEHYLLFLCSHAAGGSWAGLRWLCDIAEFLRIYGPEMDAALCVHLARRAGLARAVGVTLELLHSFLDFRFAPLDALRDAHTRALAATFATRPFKPFLTGTVAGIHRDRLRAHDGLVRQIKYLARLLRPTFQEWADGEGNLRGPVAAQALRITRLGKAVFGADAPSPEGQAA